MNIATTIEQSKHLIELGIDPSSADMCWQEVASVYSTWKWELMTYPSVRELIDVPAWSLSALLELIPCADLVKLDITWSCGSILDRVEAGTPIEATYKMVCRLKENGII